MEHDPWICDDREFESLEEAEQYAAKLAGTVRIQRRSEVQAAERSANRRLGLWLLAVPVGIMALVMLEFGLRKPSGSRSDEWHDGYNAARGEVSAACRRYRHADDSSARALCTELLGRAW